MEFEKLTRIVGRWTVTVEFEYLGDISIVANEESKIQPLKLPDGSWDQRALDQYEDFVINALEIFSAYNFSVIEERESPESQSKYYALVKKGDEQQLDYKYILYFRISDHDLNERRSNVQKQWFENHAQEMKQPKTKSYQRWKFKRITVNKDTYYSYDEALDDIENRLSGM